MKRIKKRIRKEAKEIYQRLIQIEEERRILFIIGNQRSGTTMLNEAFDRDFRSKTFGEDGGLAKGEGRGTRYRWLPYEEIARIFSSERAPLIVAKPLVESQHILEILEFFRNSKAIWMYRHYRGVVNSGTLRFGSKPTYYNLRAIIEPQPDHWYAENVSEQTKYIVSKYFQKNRSLQDLKALAWYVRNVLFFEQNLYRNQNVTLCKYEEIVTHPQQVLKRLYRFIGMSYPGDSIARSIHSHSVAKGQDINLSGDIQELCDELYSRMNKAYALC